MFCVPCVIYLLTPWCRVLEKLTGLQLVKKLPAFHGTRRFITALTSVRHLSLSWASPIQSTYSHPTSWRSVLILFTHLRLGLPSGLFTVRYIELVMYITKFTCTDVFTSLLKRIADDSPCGMSKHVADLLTHGVCVCIFMHVKLVVYINGLLCTCCSVSCTLSKWEFSSWIRFSVFAWRVNIFEMDHGSRRSDQLSRLSSVVFVKVT